MHSEKPKHVTSSCLKSKYNICSTTTIQQYKNISLCLFQLATAQQTNPPSTRHWANTLNSVYPPTLFVMERKRKKKIGNPLIAKQVTQQIAMRLLAQSFNNINYVSILKLLLLQTLTSIANWKSKRSTLCQLLPSSARTFQY